MSLVESLQPHLPSPCCVSIRWRGAARLGVATPGSERRGIREDRKGAEAVQGEAWYGGRDGQRRAGQAGRRRGDGQQAKAELGKAERKHPRHGHGEAG